MSKKKQPKQPELYDDSMQEIRASKARVNAVRKEILANMDTFGNSILDARNRLGYPEPKDSKAFGRNLLAFHMGLIELYQASLRPGFKVEKVPDFLRRKLTNPITERIATDDELHSHLELLQEREQIVREMAA